MNIQETGGYDWGSFVGDLFSKVSADRQADREFDLSIAKINALKTAANSDVQYTEGQSTTGNIITNSNLLLVAGIGAALIGIVLMVR